VNKPIASHPLQNSTPPAVETTAGLSRRALAAEGQPISFLMHKALAHPELVSLAAGFVDPVTLPVELTRQAFEVVLSDPRRARAALQYGTTPGHAPLREAVLDRLLEADGQGHLVEGAVRKRSVEQVVMTAGSNQMLRLLFDTLVDAGDIVLTAAPTYFVVLGMLGNIGARGFGIEVDEGGLVPDALEAALLRLKRSGELSRVKALYVVSYLDNPRNITIDAARRGQIVDIVKRYSSVRHPIRIIEDAAYRELRYGGEDVPSLLSYDLEGDTVIHTDTFSKAYSPGVRVGWGVLPRDLVEPLLNQKGNIDFGSPNLAQHLMAAVLESGLHGTHVEALRRAYSEKCTAMLDACDDYLAPISGVSWLRPTGGIYVWLTLPEQLAAGPGGPLFDQALTEGMLYVPGEYCYPSEGVGIAPNTIRLTFAMQTPERIRAGIEALARAIQAVLPADATARVSRSAR
jgi:2-aminoadipate transaminase